jgi:hypothetical protein
MLAFSANPSAPTRSGIDAAGDWVKALRDGAELACSPDVLNETALSQAARLAHGIASGCRQPFSTNALDLALGNGIASLGGDTTHFGALIDALVDPLAKALLTLGVAGGTLRLEVVHERTCPKFHLDQMRWRICCTLAGAGTEYLTRGEHPDDRGENHVLRVPTGVIAGMAGSIARSGLLHRSPHACPAHPRLFLSLDIG